eukprot:TRINITY_DN70570_c0_g1_i1.p1 TRINITY_DN70570_c0_g1~~TRINITY_DN70570_c0_g1_i1.p1  ORF type:complete len:104 (+),score=9.04 TRINITY_DN70570_c0_g1_i1:78-389(+)
MRGSILSSIWRHARAHALRITTKARETATQLKSDAKHTRFREVLRELAPRQLWRDFRKLDTMTQAGSAVLAYGVTTTACLYGYLRYNQVVGRRRMEEVYKSFQ